MATAVRAKPWVRWLRMARQSFPPFASKPSLLAKPQSHFALIACQRSGTHLLREIISSSPYIALLKETFSPSPKSVYWCNFVHRLAKDQFPPVTPEAAMKVFDKHMRRIARDVHIEHEWYGGPKPCLKSLGLDIKYHQLKGVAALSMNLESRPLLLDYFHSRSFRILHLTRRNIAQAAISLILAHRRNVWHSYHDADAIQGKYHISWPELHCHMLWIKQQRDEFERLSQDLSVLPLVYEDLVADLSRVTPSGVLPYDSIVLRPLAEFLDVPNHFVYDGQMRKVVDKPYSLIIENLDELVAELRNSAFAEFADTLTSVPGSVRQSLAA
jgi:LPS sulfotransferase NodH